MTASTTGDDTPPHSTGARKLEHIRIIESDPATDRHRHYFDSIRLTHRALPELDFDAVDPSVGFFGQRLNYPFLISSMTGGDHKTLRQINRNLAEAAEFCGIAMGVGSQRVMFTEPSARESFALRKVAPNALLFANLGAVQLNYGFGLAECKAAVEALEADALVLHLNPLQEVIQPEGNRDFSGLVDRIATVVSGLEVPVIAKEVGAGISRVDAELLLQAGVKIIDVAGSGGTSWSRIEQARADDSERELGYQFEDWGIPTPESLLELNNLRDRATLIASGGIRSGMDMAKAMAMGATLCGTARPYLDPAIESTQAVVQQIERFGEEFRTALFLLGIGQAESLIGRQDLLRGTGTKSSIGNLPC